MANGYDKIEYRVSSSVSCWKEWPRRLRRVYVSLEDWGSSEVAIQDMVEVWGWEWESINRLIKATPTFGEALEAFREK